VGLLGGAGLAVCRACVSRPPASVTACVDSPCLAAARELSQKGGRLGASGWGRVGARTCVTPDAGRLGG
jgi:hypothetical protein